MILWNLSSIVLIALTLREAAKNDWRMPRFNSIATVAGLWFITSTILTVL